MESKAAVQRKLKDFIQKDILRDPDYRIEPDEPLISGGLIDSFSIVQIAVFVEETFGVVIPDTELTVEEMDTLNQIAERVLSEKRR
ncbi:MAG: D-alanine--poly(phosphoribitol) ligase subunit 2 [Acidobacteria bacterium]|nr:D-alanine--poly(phosphoribitol) ligase subunit 2 [Acidobacteriota bacterium]